MDRFDIVANHSEVVIFYGPPAVQIPPLDSFQRTLGFIHAWIKKLNI